MTSIGEEPTEANLMALVDNLPGRCTPLERVLMASFGTNQTQLSVIFKTPIRVEVLSQFERYGVVIRWSVLMAGLRVVCLAESVMPLSENQEGFITLIRDKKVGIGQAISRMGLDTRRELLGFYVNDLVVARNYRISGEAEVVITETFPRATLKEAG
jgi:hypothetical protein